MNTSHTAGRFRSCGSLSLHETQAAIAWHLTEGVEEFHVGALVLDSIAAALGIALLAWLAERRR